MKNFLISLLIANSFSVFSQVRIFSGFIDKYPIQLVTYSYSDGDTRAIYAYDKYDSPIIIDGRQNNDSLRLFEYGENGISATFEFIHFNSPEKDLMGEYILTKNQKRLDVKLTKHSEFDYYDSTSFEKIELLQPASTRDDYFKLIISKAEKEEMRVTGVRIYRKKTDKLIQELELDCQFWGLNNISVGDYNFDGIDDFSVFESSYAGPNTSSIYILKLPDSDLYFISDFGGTSLEFDSGEKLIYEHNQCCAGTSFMNAVYKVENNQMVLVQQTCLKYDEETEELIEVPCE